MKKISMKSKILVCSILITCILVSVSLLAPGLVDAGESKLVTGRTYGSHGSLSISGDASIDYKPDRMLIKLRLKAWDPNSAEKATDDIAARIDILLGLLKELGISEDNVDSTGYTISQRYRYEYDKKGNYIRSVFDGYDVVNTLEITLGDFNKSGKVIDSIAQVNGLVDSINFELSSEKLNELKIEAMRKAAEDARLKAEAIIGALNETLGNVTSVSLNEYQYYPYLYWDRAELEASGVSSNDIIPPTKILPRDLTVSADVYVVFDII